MVTWIYKREEKLKKIICLLYIACNLIGLVFIIKLANYDAAITYSGDSGEILEDVSLIAYSLLLLLTFNLVFAFTLFIKSRFSV